MCRPEGVAARTRVATCPLTSTTSLGRQAIGLRQVVRHPDDRGAASASVRPGSRCRVVSGSSDEVGSSMSTTSGSVSSVRARQTRCASPPERSSAARSSRAGREPHSVEHPHDTRLVEIGRATSEVVAHGSGEEHRLLEDHADPPTQRERIETVRSRAPSSSTRPSVGTSSRLHRRSRVRLACAGRPEDDGPPARRRSGADLASRVVAADRPSPDVVEGEHRPRLEPMGRAACQPAWRGLGLRGPCPSSRERRPRTRPRRLAGPGRQGPQGQRPRRR